MRGSTKSVNAVPGFCARSATVRLRRSAEEAGAAYGRRRSSGAGGSAGAGAGAGGAGGFAAVGSAALISLLNSSRISPSAVKIRLSVTLIVSLLRFSAGTPHLRRASRRALNCREWKDFRMLSLRKAEGRGQKWAVRRERFRHKLSPPAVLTAVQSSSSDWFTRSRKNC